MNVESLHVENFKSIREVDVEFSDLNVFVGQNAAGKSNLFEAFQFLRDIRHEGLSDAVQLQGGLDYLKNIKIGKEKDICIRTKMDTNKSEIESESGNNFSIKIIKVEIEFEEEDSKYSYTWERPSTVEADIDPTIFKMEQYGSTGYLTGNKGKSEGAVGINSIIESNPSFGRQPAQLGSTFDIEPRRIKTDNSLTGKTNLQPDGSNLALVVKKLLEDDGQKQKFLSLVSDVLPFVSDTKVEAMPDQSLFLEILEEFEPGQDQYIPAEMLSDGTLRVLALIYLLYFSDHEKIFIEEPGRNIHPSLIANLMLKVKDAAENTDKQIFLTTHNVEVLRHTPPEDVRLVSRDEDGFTQVERPAESERVQKFLENDLGMVDLYTENMLGE